MREKLRFAVWQRKCSERSRRQYTDAIELDPPLSHGPGRFIRKSSAFENQKEIVMSMTAAETPRTEQLEDTVRSNALAMTSVISERMPYFRHVAMRRLDNVADAEDAVQDAFLSAWKHLGQFKGQAQMSTWLTTIVTNSSRMIIRKRSRLRVLSIDNQDENENTSQLAELLVDCRPDPETEFRNSECDYRLQHLSSRLPPSLRVIVHKRSIEGLSIRETAEALGLTESAVKSRAARARAQLRRLDQGASRRRMPAPAPRTRQAKEPASLSVN
jgi:RNA polymerase sigma-70 factor, ECF subfamily